MGEWPSGVVFFFLKKLGTTWGCCQVIGFIGHLDILLLLLHYVFSMFHVMVTIDGKEVVRHAAKTKQEAKNEIAELVLDMVGTMEPEVYFELD
mgnify:CR=1 FL=1